jgi:hypothetical protein
MNEQLRQLMVEADYPAPELAPRAQKLVELIVRDIHQYVDGMDTAQVISNGILKRYGVEL